MAKKSNQRPENAPRNFVHLHGLSFNKSAVFEDKRKAFKKGKRKHKAAWNNDPAAFFIDAFGSMVYGLSLRVS